MRSIVWPQEVVEVAKVLEEKKSASGFWKAKLIVIHEKKDKGHSTPSKLLKSKIVRKAKM
jgi:hypothetical protein